MTETYHKLQRNEWHPSAVKLWRHDIEDVECSCTPRSAGGQSCGSDACFNRSSFVECKPATCPCGAECENQRLQRGSDPGLLEVKLFQGRKGHGVVARRHIPQGSLIAEYIGEIITQAELARRMQNQYRGMGHTYIMTYTGGAGERGLLLDATVKGGAARFINHGCDPNAYTQKVVVAGETRVGIFAARDIPAGEEILYNYRLDWNGWARVACECGAANCVGTLGGDATTATAPHDQGAFEDENSFWREAAEQHARDAAAAHSDGPHQARNGAHACDSELVGEHTAPGDGRCAPLALGDLLQAALDKSRAGQGEYESVFDGMSGSAFDGPRHADIEQAWWQRVGAVQSLVTHCLPNIAAPDLLAADCAH